MADTISKTKTEGDEWLDAIEYEPVFIASQFRPGHVLTDGDVAAIQALISELDAKENAEIDLFQQGRVAGFREIGGEDLVTSVELKDAERIARHVKKAIDKMFPNRRTQ